eukprot:6465121-Amphidinium_carterae.1
MKVGTKTLSADSEMDQNSASLGTCIHPAEVQVLLSYKNEVWAVDADANFVRNDLPDGVDSHLHYQCYTLQPLEDIIQVSQDRDHY